MKNQVKDSLFLEYPTIVLVMTKEKIPILAKLAKLQTHVLACWIETFFQAM